MTTLVTIILAALQTVMDLMNATGFSDAAVTKVVTLLEEIVPLIVKEATDVIPFIKNIITDLRAKSSTLSSEQIAQLAAMDAACDAAFEEQAAKDGDPDPSAPATGA